MIADQACGFFSNGIIPATSYANGKQSCIPPLSYWIHQPTLILGNYHSYSIYAIDGMKAFCQNIFHSMRNAFERGTSGCHQYYGSEPQPKLDMGTEPLQAKITDESLAAARNLSAHGCPLFGGITKNHKLSTDYEYPTD